MLFTACEPANGLDEDNNGDKTEQPGNTPTEPSDPVNPDTPDIPDAPTAPEAIFDLTPANCEVTAEGGTITLTLRYDVDEEYLEYAIYDEQYNVIGWIELVDVRTNTMIMVFNVSANTSSKNRKAIIGLFDTKNNKEQSTIITQEAGEETQFVVTPTTATISAEGGNVEFSLLHDTSKSNISYTIEYSAQSWLSLSGTRSITSYYTFAAKANTSTSSRTGKITFSDKSSGAQQTVIISQSGASGGNDDKKKIYYTTSYGEVSVYNTSAFNAKIVSNTCTNGSGVITFDKELTTVGEKAFYNCTNLKSITLPESVSTIGVSAFEGCANLTSCPQSQNLKTIGNRAFCNCYLLKTISIGNNVTTIGDEAFYNLPAATSLTIGNKVSSIGNSAFKFCTALTYVSIPNSVQTIGNSAFEQCEALTTIVLGSGINSIGERAFYNCESLQSIKLPNAITTIKKETFGYCEKLANITLPAELLSIEKGAFNNCESLNQVLIPSKTKTIDDAFYYAKIKYLEIPKSVTSIAEGAFYWCDIEKLLININTPDYSYTDSPFEGARLYEIIIGDDVTKIGTWTFDSGSTITIGSKVTSLGEYCFGGVLSKLYCKPSTPPDLQYTLNINPAEFKLYVPRNSVGKYKNSDNVYWSSLAMYTTEYDF